MTLMRKLLLVLVAFNCVLAVSAQQSRVDSLKPLLAQQSDTARIHFLLLISEAYLGYSAKKAIDPAAEARVLAAQAGDEKKEANALLALGKAYAQTGNMQDAIASFNQSVLLMKKVGTSVEVGDLLINEGNAYNDAGSYDQALTTSLEAYKIFEKANDKRGMARALIVSGNVYRLLENYDKAVTDYERALTLSTEIHDTALQASCLNNLSIVYGAKGEHDSALTYLRQARKIHEQSGNYYPLAKVLNNMGGEYFEKAMMDTNSMYYQLALDTAIEYYLAALDLRKKIGDRRGQASSLNNLGAVSLEQGNVDKAIEYFQRARELALEIQSLDMLMLINESLYEAYVRKGDVELALKYFRDFADVKDSIYTSDMSNSIAEMQARFDVEKAESEARATEKQKTIIIWSSVIAGILMFIIIFFIWRQSKERERVNVELNQQKQEIESKNVALNSANQEIELKNKDITDSIRYARRIQEAILPELEFMTTFGKTGFVLFKPKDIVSGDFYWMARKGEYLLFAAVDCTGHGVPGAFVSIVCSNLLSQSVNEHGLIQPHDILNDVNARLSVTLRQRLDESKVRDGMDIALCVLNTSTGMLSFAGAFNPAWIVRDKQIIELKADKFPVGNFEDEALRVFAKHDMQLQKGDRIYVFSDGFSDQFGGPQGKKYKRVKFVDFLIRIQQHPLYEHKGLLEREHLAWRGEMEQIDDIVVMGIEYPVQA
jgi:serine phosphatase RsbU (regulator of sigma subunit)/lipopolysaccharide biosynthesis regulator YciM